MAGVSIVFKLIDEMSGRLNALSGAGNTLISHFESIENSANQAFSNIETGTERAAQSIEENLSQAFENIDTGIGSIETNMETFGNSMEEGASNLESITEASESLIDAEEALSEALDGNVESLDGATEAIEELGETISSTVDGIDKTTDSLGGLSEKYRESGEESEHHKEETEKTKEALLELEDVLMAMGIVEGLNVLIGAFRDATEEASEFESALAVVSTIADSNQLSMQEISEQVKTLSKNSAQSVSDLSEATYGAISASIATADAVRFVEQANQLAIGGFTNQATAVDVLTTSLNAYGLSATETGQIADYLVTTQNLGKTTVDQLASSIGMVIPTAAAFNVEMDNLSTAYAILTANGVQTAQSTTYLKAMMSELADNGSAVSATLREETGQSFAELMESGYSLGDVMQILGDSVDGNTTAFMNLWSSMEAGSGAVSLYNSGAEKYTAVLEQMQNSAGATEKAYEIMTDTTAYSAQRLENNIKNLSIAFGEELNPTIRDFQMGLADILEGFTSILEEYPELSAIITGLTVGVSASVIAVGTYTAATKLATIITTSWGASLQAALPFLGLLTGAVAIFTAGLVYSKSAMEESIEEQYILTSASTEQAAELESLTAEYENVVSIQGVESEQALRLKYQIDELTASYESSKQTVDDYIASIEANNKAYEEARQTYVDNIKAIEDEKIVTMSLVQQLEDLASSSEKTELGQAQMESIISRLNTEITGLNLTYEDFIANQDSSIEAIKVWTEEGTKQEKLNKIQEEYQALISSRTLLDNEAIGIQEELTAKQESYNTAKEKFIKLLEDNGHAPIAYASKEAKELKLAEENLKNLEDKLGETNAKISENETGIKSLTDEWGKLGFKAESISEKQVTAEEAVNAVIFDNYEAIEALSQAYDEAYEAALSSVEGQYSLWDEVKAVVAMTSQEINTAIQSQIDYWNSYNSNLQALGARATDIAGLESVLQELNDGSSESAAMIAGMAQMSDEELGSMVSKYNELQASQDSVSESMAEVETSFTNGLDNIKSAMETAVDEMNLSEEAAAAAKSTMDAYINAIKLKTIEVNSAMSAIKMPGTLPGIPMKAYARGTLDAAPGLALVGEEGPELINFKGGEVVYTADETAALLSKESGNGFFVNPSENSTTETTTKQEDKVVTIKLEGVGEIKAGAGTDKNKVLDILMSNIKPVLMGIIKQEIMEEGDLSYEY